MLDECKVAVAYGSDRAKVRRLLVRPMVDAAVAFVILCVASLALSAVPSKAGPNSPAVLALTTMPPAVQQAIAAGDVRPVVEFATTSSPNSPDAVYRRTSFQAAWGLLILSLSVIAAVNMALFRHLRQAYAPPTRRKRVV